MKKIIIQIIGTSLLSLTLLFALFTLGYNCARHDYEKEKAIPDTIILSDDFDLSVEKAFLQTITNEKVYIYIGNPIYSDWNMVNVLDSKFGYRQKENNLEVIIGNHDGSDINIFIIEDVNEAQTIAAEDLLGIQGFIPDPSSFQDCYLQFSKDGKRYLLTRDLQMFEFI